VTSALVVGTMAPDFEYFFRLMPGSGFGHTLAGAFLLSLPLALVVLWLFHVFVKRPLVECLPNGLQRRLTIYLGLFRFSPPARFALITVSALLGIATHILWDSFTHLHTWLYSHWSSLRQEAQLPMGRTVPYVKLLQYGSSVLGLVVLAIWLLHWYRTAEPVRTSGRPISSGQKLAIVACITAIALLGSIARILVLLSSVNHSPATLAAGAVCTFIPLVWWQFVLLGLFTRGQKQSRVAV